MPVWEGHEDTVRCYEHVRACAFENFKALLVESGLISPFIDTAFNGNLFTWDSAFNMMYSIYFSHIVDFQTTLDNFYARQHADGFICRELPETEAGDRFSRDDPYSTGFNTLPLADEEGGGLTALGILYARDDIAECSRYSLSPVSLNISTNARITMQMLESMGT